MTTRRLSDTGVPIYAFDPIEDEAEFSKAIVDFETYTGCMVLTTVHDDGVWLNYEFNVVTHNKEHRFVFKRSLHPDTERCSKMRWSILFNHLVTKYLAELYMLIPLPKMLYTKKPIVKQRRVLKSLI